MFSLELEDSDRLVNLVLGRLSKELDGFNWIIGKNGASLDIGFNDLVVFLVFLKRRS